METMMNSTGVDGWMISAAYLALGATAVSAVALLLLHGLSPEFAWSWRMVSEYANGRFAWLLTVVFAGWAISSFALAAALWPLSQGTLGRIGLLFLVLAGIGQTMGGLFDINHRLHGPAAMIGIPSLCVAAVLLTIALSRRAGIAAPPMWSAHLPWISFVLMIGAFALLNNVKSVSVVEPGWRVSGARPWTRNPPSWRTTIVPVKAEPPHKVSFPDR